MKSQTPDKEFNRVIELAEYDLDYSSLNEQFKDLSKLAARIAGTEISLVNIIDSYTQWTVSKHGMEIDSIPREESVCHHTILNGEHLEINNLSIDDRVKDKFYVQGDPHLRYYFGLPLQTSRGNNIGALCVLDTKKKSLTREKIELLKIIASEIVSRLENIKEINDLQSNVKKLTDFQKKVSHDIRGPLSGIIGLSELIKDQGRENKIDEILEMMNIIELSGKSILELADEILDSSNINQPKRNEFNLQTFKHKLEQLYLPQAKAKNVEFNVTMSEKNSNIPFSKNKLIQITGNLISNAIRFTPKNGSVAVELLLENKKNSKNLYISVADTGVGIDKSKLTEIKDGTGKSTHGTSGERGYGFGLPLVNHLVDSLNGSLNIHAVEGEGTTFSVVLPRK